MYMSVELHVVHVQGGIDENQRDSTREGGGGAECVRAAITGTAITAMHWAAGSPSEKYNRKRNRGGDAWVGMGSRVRSVQSYRGLWVISLGRVERSAGASKPQSLIWCTEELAGCTHSGQGSCQVAGRWGGGGIQGGGGGGMLVPSQVGLHTCA